MNRETLSAKLEDLRTQLAGASALDEQTHDRLRTLVADIERSLADESGVPAGGELLSQQVDDLVLKFEADHPQLTSALNQVAVALSNLGI